uniref:F-box/LRR-repeat protein 15/At3g58940/PEG3-like LRR domain-containing protein n=1 Tax=Arundo donax TaxID=35708 RepID=A0A0A9BHG3_ARUDO
MCRFVKWFDEILRHLCGTGGLQELGIWNTKFNDCYVLPSSVYCCTTLTSLELFCCRLRLPATLTGLRAVRSLQLRNVVASDGDLRRIIARCSAMEHLEIDDVHKARNIVICAPSLEKLEISSYRPLWVSVQKAPRLDTAELSLCYDWAENSWSVHDTQDSDGDHSFSEIEEMFDFEKMQRGSARRRTRLGIWWHFSVDLRQEAPIVLVDWIL